MRSLGSSSAAAPVRVVDHMLALQGQDLGQALWGVGVRAHGLRREDVLAAFDRRELVRSWPMRGTLHVIRPDDLRLMLSLTATRTVQSTGRRRAELGLEDATIGHARDRAIALLHGGRSLDREALLAGFRDVGISTDQGRGYHLLFHLSQDGLIAWGPTAGTGQRIVLLDEWAPPGPLPDRDDALRRALLGYLRGRAPATLADFAAWTKLPLRDARAALALAGHEVEVRSGVPGAADALLVPADAPPAVSIPSAHLLPGFDEYLLGYADRSAVLDPAFAGRVVPGMNGVFLPMVVVRGEIVGTWKRAATARVTRITVTPFRALGDAAARAVDAAAERYGAFIGAGVDLTYT